ncbi:MAG: hypothetical protein H6822_00225 [Planctomycetaceae bacterium]|nr:hypothetical protein [Planctomycetales bacterium]MCB9920571.1 hypothetical protein [Planctomycetaceae bacterium]
MRRIVTLEVCGASLFTVALLTAGIGRAETKSAATIISPQANSIVGRVTEVVYETTQPGVPLVLVAADQENTEWWVQPLAKSPEPGRHTVKAYFGNSQTPQGKPFLMMVMVAPNERTAEIMTKQQVFTQLPKYLLTSEPVRVLRKLEAEPTAELVTAPATVAAEFVQVENRSLVARRQELRGRLQGDIDPVILVRAVADSMWWVQDRVKRNANGDFTASVRFGNEKTAAGSEFHVIAVTPRSTSEAASFTVGQSMKDLPDEAILSDQMTFVLKSDELIGAE